MWKQMLLNDVKDVRTSVMIAFQGLDEYTRIEKIASRTSWTTSPRVNAIFIQITIDEQLDAQNFGKL